MAQTDGERQAVPPASSHAVDIGPTEEVEERVALFAAATGVSRELADGLLRCCNYNLEQAFDAWENMSERNGNFMGSKASAVSASTMPSSIGVASSSSGRPRQPEKEQASDQPVDAELIAMFVSLTEGTNEEAEHFLRLANGDLQQAVNLFLDDVMDDEPGLQMLPQILPQIQVEVSKDKAKTMEKEDSLKALLLSTLQTADGSVDKADYMFSELLRQADSFRQQLPQELLQDIDRTGEEGLLLVAKAFAFCINGGATKTKCYRAALTKLVIHYLERNMFHEGAYFADEEVKLTLKMFGKTSREYALALGHKARCCLIEGRIFKEWDTAQMAEPLYKKAFRILLDMGGPEDLDLRQLVHEMDELYNFIMDLVQVHEEEYLEQLRKLIKLHLKAQNPLEAEQYQETYDGIRGISGMQEPSPHGKRRGEADSPPEEPEERPDSPSPAPTALHRPKKQRVVPCLRPSPPRAAPLKAKEGLMEEASSVSPDHQSGGHHEAAPSTHPDEVATFQPEERMMDAAHEEGPEGDETMGVSPKACKLSEASFDEAPQLQRVS